MVRGLDDTWRILIGYEWEISRILKWRYCTIEGHSLGVYPLKFRPKKSAKNIWNRYLQSIGSWVMTIECPAIPLHMIHNNSWQGWSGPFDQLPQRPTSHPDTKEVSEEIALSQISWACPSRNAKLDAPRRTRGVTVEASRTWTKKRRGKKNGGKFRSTVYKPISCLALNSPIFARTINWTHPQILEKETKPKTVPLVQSVFCTHHPAHKTLGWEPFFCLSWNRNLLATL